MLSWLVACGVRRRARPLLHCNLCNEAAASGVFAPLRTLSPRRARVVKRVDGSRNLANYMFKKKVLLISQMMSDIRGSGRAQCAPPRLSLLTLSSRFALHWVDVFCVSGRAPQRIIKHCQEFVRMWQFYRVAHKYLKEIYISSFRLLIKKWQALRVWGGLGSAWKKKKKKKTPSRYKTLWRSLEWVWTAIGDISLSMNHISNKKPLWPKKKI